MSKSPIILISSEVPTSIADNGTTNSLHQSRDQGGIFESLAKAVLRPRTAREALLAAERGIAEALTSPRGPVYIGIPADVLSERIEEWTMTSSPVRAPESPLADDSLDVIASAQSVAFWVGGGVLEADAELLLAEVAERLRAPVFVTFGSRGVLSRGHPCSVGLPPHEPEVEEFLSSAEVLVGVGSQFDGMMTKNGTLRLPKTVINVNLVQDIANVNTERLLKVTSDAGVFLAQLLALPRRSTGLADELPELKERVWERLRFDPRTQESSRLVDMIQALASPTTALVCDMTIAGYWLSSYFEPAASRRLQYPVGWGTLGYALPAAIGAAHSPGCSVLVVCGDGGVMFALGELATITQEHLPITVLVVDDDGYGMLRYDQDHAGAPHRGVDLWTPDFVNLAAAFSIKATSCRGVGPNLDSLLREALAAAEPRLVVCKARLFPPRTTSPRWSE